MSNRRSSSSDRIRVDVSPYRDQSADHSDQPLRQLVEAVTSVPCTPSGIMTEVQWRTAFPVWRVSKWWVILLAIDFASLVVLFDTYPWLSALVRAWLHQLARWAGPVSVPHMALICVMIVPLLQTLFVAYPLRPLRKWWCRRQLMRASSDPVAILHQDLCAKIAKHLTPLESLGSVIVTEICSLPESPERQAVEERMKVFNARVKEHDTFVMATVARLPAAIHAWRSAAQDPVREIAWLEVTMLVQSVQDEIALFKQLHEEASTILPTMRRTFVSSRVAVIDVAIKEMAQKLLDIPQPQSQDEWDEETYGITRARKRAG